MERGKVQTALTKAIGAAASKFGSARNLAREIPVTEGTLSSWRRGRTEPTNTQFLRVFELAGLSVDEECGLRAPGQAQPMDEKRIAEMAADIIAARMLGSRPAVIPPLTDIEREVDAALGPRDETESRRKGIGRKRTG